MYDDQLYYDNTCNKCVVMQNNKSDAHNRHMKTGYGEVGIARKALLFWEKGLCEPLYNKFTNRVYALHFHDWIGETEDKKLILKFNLVPSDGALTGDYLLEAREGAERWFKENGFTIKSHSKQGRDYIYYVFHKDSKGER